VHLTATTRNVLTCAAAAFAAAALSTAPASAHTVAPAAGCPAAPISNPFAVWQDAADYVLAPDGGLEAGGAAWQLQGGAKVIEGNEPFRALGATDHAALDLPAGSSATTAPMCIGLEHKSMRFFGSGTMTGQLSVEALYTERDGRPRAVTLGTVHGRGTWAPTESLPMKVNERAPDFGNALQVSLRFTPHTSRGWRIDDVFVDPYRVR
jgi:hypothetical protein